SPHSAARSAQWAWSSGASEAETAVAHSTRLAPSTSVATAATSAESAPPENATTTGPRWARTALRRASAAAEAGSVVLPRLTGSAYADGAEDILGVSDYPGVEGAELAVVGRSGIESHRVDAVLQIIGMDPEQGDAPLPVVESRRTGDELEHAVAKLPASGAVALH